jgi:hypothetical protein
VFAAMAFAVSGSVFRTSTYGAETDRIALESPFLQFSLSASDGSYTLVDRKGQTTWQSSAGQARFGSITCRTGDRSQTAPLTGCQVKRSQDRLEATFHPLADRPGAWMKVTIRLLSDTQTLEFSYEADPGLGVETVRLLDEGFPITSEDKGYVAVPVREGLLIPSDSGKTFTHRFDTYTYEGCHMAMFGVVKAGAAALLTWDDPYVALDVQSRSRDSSSGAGQVLTCTLAMSRSARSFQVRVCGPGDHVTIAKAYREVAKSKGWWAPWSEKLKARPDRARLFGAINYKLWSTLSRTMNEESTQEKSVSVNWTFDEAAQVAEHLKNDLQINRVLFTLGGWIHRGYDNQHPDVLPAAPECGGDQALADCSRRVLHLGYLLCLHDNYQDIYRDSPSWNERYIMKNPDGSLIRGGHWAGGLAFVTCSSKALELAQRPQNLAAVEALTHANGYFIDTTYAAGLMECFDPNHPLTRLDDMKWKQALSDYARQVFGVFGSECGREWAIPHSDFFEGLTGVSGGDYHDAKLIDKVGGIVVPMFEIVYRDCIAMYGKYGYAPESAAEYVLRHISIARPLNYHSVPTHLYWKQAATTSLALQPGVAEVSQSGPRRVQITYTWKVSRPAKDNWRVFVHFTDADGNIKFQNDYEPQPPVAQWQAGEVSQGPFTVTVPQDLSGTFNVRTGLFQPASGQRANLEGLRGSDRSYQVGVLTVTADSVAFQPAANQATSTSPDAALFTRADNGWAENCHPFDRFVKNTAEILSPLNELTAQLPMTQHEFLSPDHKVQHTVFGQGSQAVHVIVNAGSQDVTYRSKLGGEVVLPKYGFVAEAPDFVAFHASKWNGTEYKDPPLFTLRSLDGKPLAQSGRIRVFHAFGDSRIKLGSQTIEVTRETVYAQDH